jgi:hypothetical protein
MGCDMIVKNKSNEIVNVLGVELNSGEEVIASDIGSVNQFKLGMDEILELVSSSKIAVCYTDGTEITSLSRIVEVLSNGVVEVVVNNSSEEEGKYYFLKDMIKVTKDAKVYKTFKGMVDSLYLTPTNDKLNVMIMTGDGLELPVDSLSKRQTLEFEFAGKIKDPKIEFSSDNGTVEVEVFMEGRAKDTAKNLQQFINTWYENDSMWGQEIVEPIVINWTINNWKWAKDTKIDGTILTIPEDKKYKNSKEFEVYSIGKNEIVVEYLEWNYWTAWNPNQLYIQVKGITEVKFNDCVINVDSELIEWENRKDDGRHY